MPIRDYHFTTVDEVSRPMLLVRIFNPKDPTKYTQPISAKVDPGTDVSIFPSGVAEELDIDLSHAKKVKVTGVMTTGEGRVSKARIEVLEPDHSLISGATQTSDICFVESSCLFLLGANFLKPFVLTIDYPNKVFSITRP